MPACPIAPTDAPPTDAAPVAPQPGLARPVLDSQRVFRAVLRAMSRPGVPVALPVLPPAPLPLTPATVALCLTLADFETPLWLDRAATTPAALAHLRFHCGCPIVTDPAAALFAVIGDGSTVPPLNAFAPGEPDYPDRSATLVVQVAGFGTGPRRMLHGPGIETSQALAVSGLSDGFWAAWRDNTARYPLGVDVVLASPDALVGLPRTVQIH
ncbi:MAG: phosphonate C-P lyase system protein PhnH [Azospirillum sp.]|nr:phosphonate C-P lyase system protein PhnH [Azospirillum sp.]